MTLNELEQRLDALQAEKEGVNNVNPCYCL